MKKLLMGAVCLFMFAGCQPKMTPEQFQEGLQKKDRTVITAGVKKGFDINKGDMTGMTPLMKDIYNKDAGWITFLLEQGADPDLRDKSGKTTLFHAVQAGDLNMVKLLLDSKADPDIKTNNGETPLSTAMKMKKLEIFKVLLEYGAHPGIPDSKGELVYYTATGAYHDAVRGLYEPVKIEQVVNGKKTVVTRMKVKKTAKSKKLQKRLAKRIARRKSKFDQDGKRRVTNISAGGDIIFPGGLGDTNHSKKFAKPVITKKKQGAAAAEAEVDINSMVPGGLGETGNSVVKPVITH